MAERMGYEVRQWMSELEYQGRLRSTMKQRSQERTEQAKEDQLAVASPPLSDNKDALQCPAPQLKDRPDYWTI